MTDQNEVEELLLHCNNANTDDNTEQLKLATTNNDDFQLHTNYRIALYYCYIPIPTNHDLDRIVQFHTSFNINNHGSTMMGGRVRVSYEGINGVLSGTIFHLLKYEQQLRTLLQSIHDNDIWEFYVKYCHLRTDLSIADQLFSVLQVQVTDTVVALVEKDVLTSSSSSSSPNVNPAQEIEKYDEGTVDGHENIALISNTGVINATSSVPSTNTSRRRRKQQQQSDDRMQQRQQQEKEVLIEMTRSIYHTSILEKVCHQQIVMGATHLTPVEWNTKLEQLVQRQRCGSDNNNTIVLLDCRNCYESAIGYFQVPGATTILTNTRKYSELPQVLLNQLLLLPSSSSSSHSATDPVCTDTDNNDMTGTTSEQLQQKIGTVSNTLRNASHIFMYCTGGVRCERASAFLQAAIRTTTATSTESVDVKPEIYQLHGGIQRYLEQYGTIHNSGSNNIKIQNGYYRGKNFVFDLRRTDPTVLPSPPHQQAVTSDTPDVLTSSIITHPNVVGTCLVCARLHDDYDNGYAPILQKETRCYKCRILILVCNQCRTAVRCWGDDSNRSKKTPSSDSYVLQEKRRLYCGGLEPNECLYMPPIKVIEG